MTGSIEPFASNLSWNEPSDSSDCERVRSLGASTVLHSIYSEPPHYLPGATLHTPNPSHRTLYTPCNTYVRCLLMVHRNVDHGRAAVCRGLAGPCVLLDSDSRLHRGRLTTINSSLLLCFIQLSANVRVDETPQSMDAKTSPSRLIGRVQIET